MELNNKVALVTGAASGIGRGIALALARRGCDLALLDVNADGLAATGKETEALGVKVATYIQDVSDLNSLRSLPNRVFSDFPAVDILVNNAGIAVGGEFLQVEEADFDKLLTINFHAKVLLTRLFLPHLQERPRAQVVYISSLFGLISPPGHTAYSASKFALRGFANSLRFELMGSNVKVCVVHPGGVSTDIARNAKPPIGVSEEEIRDAREEMQKFLRMPAEKAGEIIVRGMKREKARILVGWDAKLLARIERWFPVGYWKILNTFRKEKS